MLKTEKRAATWLNDSVAGWSETQLKTLMVLLKEQDRDTRHACAESVLNCEEDVSGECIWKNDAHSACMNVQAV